MEVDAVPLVAAACRCFGTEVGHAAKTEDRRRKLSEQVSELRCLRNDVQKEVDDAPRAGREPTEVARGWLKRADNIIRRADSAVAKAPEEGSDGGAQGRCSSCYAHGWWRRYKLGKRITKVTKHVVRHEEKGKALKILRDGPPAPK